MVQRKFGGFLHSICETYLRLFHVPVPRSKQVPLDHRWLQDGHWDTLGPAGHHIAQSSDLHRLLSSFHRDRPKSSRNLPKWNLSVVLNELTKAPFEPMKDTDLKHLTLKTAFLLALASAKRRSEIHAWVANKVSNLGCRVPFFRLYSQKPTSKRRFSKCVPGDYSCFDYHCR